MGTALRPGARPAEVVLGLGSCVDYEIAWDPATVQELVDRHGLVLGELDRSAEPRDERDLLRSILGFLRDGAGGERFVPSPAVLLGFARRFRYRETLGGTNVRAAIALSRLGIRSTVHLVSIDDTVRRLLPAETSYLCSAERDSLDPHLIVQFPAGARVRVGDRVLEAPQANRLIYVNDAPNRRMELSPRLGQVLGRARVLLVSGFNTVQDVQTLTTRLTELRRHLEHLPPDAVVLFEDAGYHLPGMNVLVREALLDRVDVHGMNEDELQSWIGHPLDLLDPPQVVAGLAELRDVLPARNLVVHTRYWSLALGEQAEWLGPALESATAMAGARYLHGDGFTAADHRRMAGEPRHPGGLALAAAVEELTAAGRFRAGRVRCVPAYSLDAPEPTTVGLGDAFVGGLVAALARPGGLGPPGVVAAPPGAASGQDRRQ